MSTFAHDLRQLLHARIDAAPLAESLGLALGLCSAEAANQPVPIARKAPAIGERFIKLGVDGEPLRADDDDWVAVYDSQQQLTWTRSNLDCGEVNWERALKEAASVKLFAKNDWRAPTIRELLSIVDYERCDPAIDTGFFSGKFGWTWTSTPAAAPAGYAWSVCLDDGDSYRDHQDNENFVRAVRAGQLFGL